MSHCTHEVDDLVQYRSTSGSDPTSRLTAPMLPVMLLACVGLLSISLSLSQVAATWSRTNMVTPRSASLEVSGIALGNPPGGGSGNAPLSFLDKRHPLTNTLLAMHTGP